MKECPKEVIKLGCEMVKARRIAEKLRDQIMVAIKAMDNVKPVMARDGARHMEYGEAIAKLMQAAMADGLIGAAHDHLRKKLNLYDYCEPTDEQILGGGGGGPR